MALVLSSGGARGLVHIGVIEELLAEGYEISSIAGCSMGALVGGIYATGRLPEFREWMKTINKRKMLELADLSLSINHVVKGERIIEAIKEIVPDVRIEEHVGEGFVQLVERLELDGPEVGRVVRASLQPLLDAGADTIVLGCTHYPFLRPVIERIAGPGVRVIDPAPAVARQVLKVLREHGLEDTGPEPGTLELLSSGDPATLHALAATLG